MEIYSYYRNPGGEKRGGEPTLYGKLRFGLPFFI
jgi:hypothetical protein